MMNFLNRAVVILYFMGLSSSVYGSHIVLNDSDFYGKQLVVYDFQGCKEYYDSSPLDEESSCSQGQYWQSVCQYSKQINDYSGHRLFFKKESKDGREACEVVFTFPDSEVFNYNETFSIELPAVFSKVFLDDEVEFVNDDNDLEIGFLSCSSEHCNLQVTHPENSSDIVMNVTGENNQILSINSNEASVYPNLYREVIEESVYVDSLFLEVVCQGQVEKENYYHLCRSRGGPFEDYELSLSTRGLADLSMHLFSSVVLGDLNEVLHFNQIEFLSKIYRDENDILIYLSSHVEIKKENGLIVSRMNFLGLDH